MARPRWTKLWRDVATERGRLLLMITSIVVSLSAVGTVLGAYAILTREIAVNYLGTRPASATLELHGDVDAKLVVEVRKRPEIAEAEARDVDLRDRDGDDVFALLTEKLALGDVLLEVLTDLAADDVAEPGMILIDLQAHLVSVSGAGGPR